MLLKEETINILQIYISDSLEATLENITIALQCCIDNSEKEHLYIIKHNLENLSNDQFLQIKSLCKKHINQHYLS